jgi:hypothetical protein
VITHLCHQQNEGIAMSASLIRGKILIIKTPAEGRENRH